MSICFFIVLCPGRKMPSPTMPLTFAVATEPFSDGHGPAEPKGCSSIRFLRSHHIWTPELDLGGVQGTSTSPEPPPPPHCHVTPSPDVESNICSRKIKNARPPSIHWRCHGDRYNSVLDVSYKEEGRKEKILTLSALFVKNESPWWR